MLLATIVDTSALAKVVLYSFAGALLLTGLFTAGVLLVESEDGTSPVPAGRRALGGLALLACLALLAFGLSVLFDK